MLNLKKTHTRYPAYKPSGIEWIGEIPDGWEMKPFKKLFRLKKDLVGDGHSKYKVLSLTLKGVIPRNMDDNFGKFPKEFDAYQIVRPDDLVFCLFDYDVTPRTVWRAEEEWLLTGAYTAFSPKSVSSRYFYYYYLSLDISKELLHLCTWLRNALNKDMFKSMKNPVPALEEQELIAEYLDEKTALINEAIMKKQRQIELLSEHRTALINNAITKGFNPNAEMRDSGIEWIGYVNKDYLLEPLKRLVKTKITDGPHATPDFVDDDTGIPFVSVEAVKDNKIDFGYRRGNISAELHEEYCKKCHPKRDDIFLVKSGSTTGKVAMVEVDFEFSIWSPLALVRADASVVLPKFLFYAMNSKIFQNQVQLFWSFGTQPNIGMGVVETLTIPVPSLQEQKEIVDYLEKEIAYIEAMKEKIERSINLLAEYKTSLISNVVRGKMKVS